MDEHEKNFKSWYIDILEKLYKNENSGFAILMITFPLLERYLRQKNDLGYTAILNTDFYQGLIDIFPEVKTIDVAKDFWGIFGNGLLHQVTISSETSHRRSLPKGTLTNTITSRIHIESDGSFVLNPALFADCVTDIIKGDFDTWVKEFDGSI